MSVTSTAWTPLDELEMRYWVEQGRRLGVIGRSAGWWLGDWLHYGNRKYGEAYARASRITGYDSQTLMNMAYVASRFDVSRRRESLSWSHHAELAALDPKDQDQWLDHAEGNRLSVRCLREEMRRVRRLEVSEHSDLASASTQPEPVVCPRCGCRLSESRAGRHLDAGGRS